MMTEIESIEAERIEMLNRKDRIVNDLRHARDQCDTCEDEALPDANRTHRNILFNLSRIEMHLRELKLKLRVAKRMAGELE